MYDYSRRKVYVKLKYNYFCYRHFYHEDDDDDDDNDDDHHHLTSQGVYVKRNIETRSQNNCCCAKAMNITYLSMCVC